MAYYIHKPAGHEKEIKRAIFCAIGILILITLFAIGFIFHQDKNEFDSVTDRQINKIHQQILDEKYREVFLESDRELIADYNETEFIAMLIKSRQYLAENPKLIGRKTTFDDTINRLKYLAGASYKLETFYLSKSTSGEAIEYFGWRISNGNIRLRYYEVRLC